MSFVWLLFSVRYDKSDSNQFGADFHMAVHNRHKDENRCRIEARQAIRLGHRQILDVELPRGRLDQDDD